MNALLFCRDLPVAIFHEIRHQYYMVAHKHAMEQGHPDASLLCTRMLVSRSKVNDFLRRYT